MYKQASAMNIDWNKHINSQVLEKKKPQNTQQNKTSRNGNHSACHLSK